VAVSGDYAIVGTYGEDGGDGDPLTNAGAAYVFRRTGDNTWDTGTKLMAPDAEEGDQFGGSVAVSGDYAIVGARCENGGGGDPWGNFGAAYVFRRTGVNSWDTGVKLVAPDAQGSDYFGNSVAVSGDYAIVGAHQEDGDDVGPLGSAGAVYMFRRTGDNTWDTGIKLVAPDAQEGDLFGTSVAVSSEHVIAGALYEDGGEGDPVNAAGAAYIYEY
jgi:hypothetical protein